MRACPECQQQVEDDARFCPFCGSASAPPTAEPVDPVLSMTVNGKFKVEKMIGQGGMGRVYRARHLTLDKPVVLKMLHREYSDDPQIVHRFQREARAASRLNHPNSIAVLDFGAAEDGTLFMAMEFLGGRDLSRVVTEEFPLGEGRIVRIGAQILSALAEAHAQGIIHRDLKPENVMVEARRDEPDFVKVLDFGIAKITASADEPKLTAVGLVCGTPEYMSPEQARGAELDPRSDLYSVGVILYQMATGQLPFESDTPVGFLTKHLAEIPVAPRQKRPEISEKLNALIVRSLEKEPAKRFADAQSMREALLACAPGAPTSVAAAPAPAPAPVARAKTAMGQAAPTAPAGPPATQLVEITEVPPPRSKVPLIAGAAVVLAVLVGVGVAMGGKKEAPPLPTPAPAPAPAPVAPPTTTPTTTPTDTAPPATPPATPPTQTPTVNPTTPPTGTKVASIETPPAGRRDRARAQKLLDQGRAALQTDPDTAIRLYREAERADPSLAEVQRRLGIAYQLKGDNALAAQAYKRYLAFNPPDAAKVKGILSTLE